MFFPVFDFDFFFVKYNPLTTIITTTLQFQTVLIKILIHFRRIYLTLLDLTASLQQHQTLPISPAQFCCCCFVSFCFSFCHHGGCTLFRCSGNPCQGVSVRAQHAHRQRFCQLRQGPVWASRYVRRQAGV